MAYFTHDNTEGYDDVDLALLNRAWESLPCVVLDEDLDDIATKSMLDHVSEELLFHYDRGWRGDALTAFYYVPDDGI